MQVPLRVDFAGGWLDVPRYALPDGRVVNCAIQPLVSRDHWPYERAGGLGGSAAQAILEGRDPLGAELSLGVGWQDPAVIRETGLCVWRSDSVPVLELKRNPDFLDGLMALHWTGGPHNTPKNADRARAYDLIYEAGQKAAEAVRYRFTLGIVEAVRMSYDAQLDEGMEQLPPVRNSIARKYCGGGWGGYALYMFARREHRDASGLLAIEPYMRCET